MTNIKLLFYCSKELNFIFLEFLNFILQINKQ